MFTERGCSIHGHGLRGRDSALRDGAAHSNCSCLETQGRALDSLPVTHSKRRALAGRRSALCEHRGPGGGWGKAHVKHGQDEVRSDHGVARTLKPQHSWGQAPGSSFQPQRQHSFFSSLGSDLGSYEFPHSL